MPTAVSSPPGRSRRGRDDKIGLAVAYARISDSARALDRDFEVLANDPRPIRDYEPLVTATYLAEIRKGWNVIPTFQYVIHPGGGYVLDNGAPRSSKTPRCSACEP